VHSGIVLFGTPDFVASSARLGSRGCYRISLQVLRNARLFRFFCTVFLVWPSKQLIPCEKQKCFILSHLSSVSHCAHASGGRIAWLVLRQGGQVTKCRAKARRYMNWRPRVWALIVPGGGRVAEVRREKGLLSLFSPRRTVGSSGLEVGGAGLERKKWKVEGRRLKGVQSQELRVESGCGLTLRLLPSTIDGCWSTEATMLLKAED
jgi:hypothetical protein